MSCELAGSRCVRGRGLAGLSVSELPRDGLLSICRLCIKQTNEHAQPAYRICIGHGNEDADLYVGSRGWIAYAARAAAVPSVAAQSNVLGACLASCLATMTAFQASCRLDQPMFHGAFRCGTLESHQQRQQSRREGNEDAMEIFTLREVQVWIAEQSSFPADSAAHMLYASASHGEGRDRSP